MATEVSADLHVDVYMGAIILSSFDSRHLKSHEKPFACTESGCPERFQYRKELTRHRRSKHLNSVEVHVCSHRGCPFSSTRRDNLLRHLRQQHQRRRTDS
jgi:uncharacterized Zn-finger protein